MSRNIGGIDMRVFCLVFSLSLVALFSKNPNIQIVGESRTPEPVNTTLVISIPEDGDVEDDPVYLQIRLEGFPLGTEPNFPREDDIYNYSMGQNMRIIIDDRPFFATVGPKLDPLQDQGDYYESNYKIKVPFALSPGKHVIRAYLARSFGESLKSEGAVTAGYFYFRTKTNGYKFDLDKPYLTYNEPSNSHPYAFKKPVLLDFLVENCTLSKDGYQVKLTIDGKEVSYLTYPPYYIRGLSKGEHTIELTLVNQNKEQATGKYNRMKRIIRVF